MDARRRDTFHGFLITHSEAISLADYYTVMDGERVAYRPTSHYAYHPSDNAVLSVHEFAGRNWHLQDRKRIMMDEITEGIDELGVLLAGHAKNAYWYGSQLSIEEARKLGPVQQRDQPAGHVGGARRHDLGDGESDTAASSSRTTWTTSGRLQICMPYLGRWSASTPTGRRSISAASCSPRISITADPWQFKNIRVGLERGLACDSAVADRDHGEAARRPAARRVTSSSRRLAEQARPSGESMLM